MGDLERIINSIIEEKVAPLQRELEKLRATVSSIADTEYYNQSQAIKKYGVSRTTLWRMQESGKIQKYMMSGKVFH